MEIYPLELGHLKTNCYLLADEATKTAALIDAPAEPNRILAFLKEKGLTLTDIVLTHGHFDHILALRKLKDATGATVSIHQNGALSLKDPALNLSDMVGLSWTPFEADRLLNDLDVLSLAGTEFQVLHTPGHTADSICLYGDGVLFTGDTLLWHTIGRTDFPTGNYQEELASIQNRLLCLPDETVYYPGHGASGTLGEERRENPYLK